MRQNLVNIKYTLSELSRYGAVGIALSGLFYLFYLVLTAAGLGPKTAATITFVIGVSLSFYSHKKITFRNTKRSKSQILKFYVLYILAYLINMYGLYLGIEILHYPHQLVQLFMIFLVAAFAFTGQKLWIFHASATPETDASNNILDNSDPGN